MFHKKTLSSWFEEQHQRIRNGAGRSTGERKCKKASGKSSTADSYELNSEDTSLVERKDKKALCMYNLLMHGNNWAEC
jgi:hypothetical protein